jgi:hypothetical protein
VIAGEAGQDILRALVDGKHCLRPDEFMRDCGECVICCFKYRDGAEKLCAGRPVRAFVPGTREHAEFAAELRDALESAPTTWTSRRRLRREAGTR